MHLKFDEQGYVCCVLYGCHTSGCIEYAGQVPTQPERYASIDDWADRAQIQAYKLNSSGNLTYDATRAAALTALPQCAPGAYSTEETLTGEVWIDGRPIYRRVFTNDSVPVSSDSDGTSLGVIPDIDVIVHARGVLTETDGSRRRQFPMPYYFDSKTRMVIGLQVLNDQNTIFVVTTRAGKVFVIVDYIKA